MNMKKVMTLAALTAAGAASAAVTTDNTLCRIEVNSGTKSTIVAVPLVKIGTGADIPVTELVLTDNLTDGDTMLRKSGEKWEAWTVVDGAWSAMTVSDSGSTLKTPEAENVALTRGNAIWVNRQVTTKPFYIYGQVAKAGSSASLPAIVSGAYTMMGNTDLADKKISALEFPGERQPSAGDKIVWSNGVNGTGVTQYEYKGSAWGSYKSTVVEKNGRKVISSEWTAVGDTDVIPAGQGFWYVAK